MAAPNPDPAHIPGALWRLWTEFSGFEPSAQLGGILARKAGYHNTRDALPASDYSTGRDVAADKLGPADKASAIDLTLSAAAMKRYTGRLDTAARARDPRLVSPRGPVLREFIGTLDGVSVYCYVLVGGRPLGVNADAGPDPGRHHSHLWHIHMSVIRQFCDDWAALDGVLSVLRGETLAAWRARTEGDNDMTPEQVKAAVVQGVHAALDQAARRSTPTGRQMGDDIAVLLAAGVAPVVTELGKVGDRLGEQVAGWAPQLVAVVREQLGQDLVDEAALTNALAGAMVQLAARAAGTGT